MKTLRKKNLKTFPKGQNFIDSEYFTKQTKPTIKPIYH